MFAIYHTNIKEFQEGPWPQWYCHDHCHCPVPRTPQITLGLTTPGRGSGRWSDGSAHLSLSPINQLQSMIPWNTALYETHNTIVRLSVSDFMHVMCHVMWLCHKIKQRFSQSNGPNPCIGHWTLNICFHFLIMHQASQYFFLTITPIKWFSPSLFINWSICTPYNQINILEKIIFRSEAIIYQRHDQRAIV